MKPLIALVLPLLLTLGWCRCSRNQNPLVGEYKIQGHDFAGKRIFNGTISVKTFANDEVKAVCYVVKVADDFEGTVNNNGPCEGETSDDKISLDLAPSMDDGGVLFEGNWSEGHISGTWSIDSFAGAKTFGTFDAVRQ